MNRRGPDTVRRVRGNDRLRLEAHVRREPPPPGVEGECWMWIGGQPDKGGYFHVYSAGKTRIAHRWAYELLNGPIPEGLTLDHLCRRPGCVNPGHLEPVTQWENNRRGAGIGALNMVKTHCPLGHPYDDVNTYIRPDGGRDCKNCINRRSRERNARRRDRRSGAAA